MIMDESIIGNVSTIVKILILTFIPAALLEHVDANALSVVITGIIMFIFSIIDAKYSNNFKILDNHTPENDIDISEEGV